MVKVTLDPGSVYGGYKVLHEAPSSPEGKARSKVQCLGCNSTCVRCNTDIVANEIGCKRCLMAANRARSKVERLARAHGKAPGLRTGRFAAHEKPLREYLTKSQ